MKRNLLLAFVAVVGGVFLEGQALGLIYLGENPLESLLVKCPDVVIGKVGRVDLKGDSGSVVVEQALKGDLKGTVAVRGVMLRVSRTEKKARFKEGDVVVLFLNAAEDGGGVVAQSQVLKTDAEKKAMAGCVAEILPDAKLLADLGDPKSKVDEGETVKVLKRLVVSENAFTQILAGRLMGTSVAERVKPDADVLFLALLSHRVELKKGALEWAKKYAELPRKVRVVVVEIAMEEKDEGAAKEAREVLRGREGKE